MNSFIKLGKCMLNLLLLGLLALGCNQSGVSTDPTVDLNKAVPNPAPTTDLGEDVMKPMGALFGSIQADLADGNKNAGTIANVKKIQQLIAVALVTTPQTNNYASTVASIGSDAAFSKYQGMIQKLNSAFNDLSTALSDQKSNTCGNPCNTVLANITALESDGHNAFRDPE